jgi:hypothetical protein
MLAAVYSLTRHADSILELLVYVWDARDRLFRHVRAFPSSRRRLETRAITFSTQQNHALWFAGANFVEQLVQFQTLSTFYLRPPAADDLAVRHAGLWSPNMPIEMNHTRVAIVLNPMQVEVRAAFGYTTEDHVYVVPHPPHKFHPDFDRTLAEILTRDPRYVLR